MTEQSTSAAPEEPKRRIAFIPLESNPTTFTKLAQKLGISSSLSFVDVYSITDPDLLSFIPRPCYALILVFPVGEAHEKLRAAEDSIPEFSSPGDTPVIWIKQTIKNACGLMALLHALLNGKARSFITPGSDLDDLLKQSIDKTPRERAELLETSPSLAAAHKTAATTGDTEAPDAEAEVDYHYVAFVRSDKDGKLYEMDGNRKGPMERAAAADKADGDDILASEEARLAVKEFMDREEGNVNFGLVALVAAEAEAD